MATPGHTNSHRSVLSVLEDCSCLFAGDVTYDQQQLLGEKLAGAHQDFESAKSTYDIIKKYAAKNKTIYLPSHDAGSSLRLLNSSFLDI